MVECPGSGRKDRGRGKGSCGSSQTWQADGGRRKRLIQEKGKISSQDIPAGTKVEAYTTLKYYISKGQEELYYSGLYDETSSCRCLSEISGGSGTYGKLFRKNTVQIQMIQMEWIWPDVEPGYVIAVSPEAGSSCKMQETL